MIKRFVDTVLIMANVRPPRAVESVRKAWRGLQALPEFFALAENAVGEHDPQGWRYQATSLESLVYEQQEKLAASQKHVAALEQQLAAVCGGLEEEKRVHESTRRHRDDALLTLADVSAALKTAKRDAWVEGYYAGVSQDVLMENNPYK